VSSAAALGQASQRRFLTAGEWWVLLVTDGFTVEYPPELYRQRDDAEREAERWARVLSRAHREDIDRPFEGRWQIGDRWIRVTYSFLTEGGSQIWVGTYWGQDGSPEPEAALFADAAEAREWALEGPAGAVPVESHETPWSVAATYRVRGGEEEAEVHRAKVLTTQLQPYDHEAQERVVFGFEVSEGLIPQRPELFTSPDPRDQALKQLLKLEFGHRDWRDLVAGTASANYVETELPEDWQDTWDESQSLEWLLGFDLVGDGDDFEIRRFETSIS
jgi:hypothetical protein